MRGKRVEQALSEHVRMRSTCMSHRRRLVLVLDDDHLKSSLLQLLHDGEHPLATLTDECDTREIFEHVRMPAVVIDPLLLRPHLPLDARVDGVVDPLLLCVTHRVEERGLLEFLALFVFVPLSRNDVAKLVPCLSGQ